MPRGNETVGARHGRQTPARLAFVLCLALAAVANPATAAAAPRDLEARLKVEGSNGFQVTISGGAYSGFRVARVEARKGGRTTSYGAVRGVTLNRHEFAANLGPIGSFDLRFEPRDARMVDGAPRCGDGRARVVSGVFAGRVDLHGEHDFTTVELTRAAGALTRSGLGYCHKSSPPPRPEGAGRRVTLSGCRADGPRAASGLIAYARTRPGPESVIWGALRFERLGGLFVSRLATLKAAGSTFAFAPGDFSLAELSPPRPFAGTATYEVSDDDNAGRGRLTGDLSAGFAGSGGRVALAPAESADFGPRKTGLLDCAFGIAPGSARRAALASAPAALRAGG